MKNIFLWIAVASVVVCSFTNFCIPARIAAGVSAIALIVDIVRTLKGAKHGTDGTSETEAEN